MLALTREVSDAIVRCELTHIGRADIDIERARAQHAAYERALVQHGCMVRRLPSDETMPDSVFIEDTAIVLPEVAIIARPGATSRRVEVTAVAEALAPLRRLVRIEPPGTLDGGDIVTIGESIFAGRSARTNDAAIAQLRAATASHGYTVTAVSVSGCLHLKSAATAIDERTVLLNPQWVSADVFETYERIEVDPGEPAAANVVGLPSAVIASMAFPRTCARLERRGLVVTRVDASELAKAEGALTCCSLLMS